MFCSNCGKELVDGAKFCAHCGTQLGATLKPNEEVITTTETSIVQSDDLLLVSSVSSTTGSMASRIATQIGDLNGDGKVDAEDWKIATANAKKFAIAATDEAGKLGKAALQSELAKDTASAAAVGAIIAVPVPVIGPVLGATVGAILGAYKNLTKK